MTGVIHAPFPVSQVAPVSVYDAGTPVVVRAIEVVGLTTGLIGMALLVLGMVAVRMLARERV